MIWMISPAMSICKINRDNDAVDESKMSVGLSSNTDVCLYCTIPHTIPHRRNEK